MKSSKFKPYEFKYLTYKEQKRIMKAILNAHYGMSSYNTRIWNRPGKPGLMIPSVWIGSTSKKKKLKIPLPMENFRIKPPRPCPWCPQRSYAHRYSYYFGLLRHVARDHMYDDQHKPVEYAWAETNGTKFIRIYTELYSKYEDIDVQGKYHVETMIYHYAKHEWNPSLRTIDKESINSQKTI